MNNHFTFYTYTITEYNNETQEKVGSLTFTDTLEVAKKRVRSMTRNAKKRNGHVILTTAL